MTRTRTSSCTHAHSAQRLPEETPSRNKQQDEHIHLGCDRNTRCQLACITCSFVTEAGALFAFSGRSSTGQPAGMQRRPLFGLHYLHNYDSHNGRGCGLMGAGQFTRRCAHPQVITVVLGHSCCCMPDSSISSSLVHCSQHLSTALQHLSCCIIPSSTQQAGGGRHSQVQHSCRGQHDAGTAWAAGQGGTSHSRDDAAATACSIVVPMLCSACAGCCNQQQLCDTACRECAICKLTQLG